MKLSKIFFQRLLANFSLPQALVETPSVQSAQKRADLLEEQRLQMEEKRRMKDEAARIARQQEFEEEHRLEVIILCRHVFRMLHIDPFITART